MGFKNKSFDTPTYIEKDLEPQRVIIISCEGENTEPEYFTTIKEKLSEYISVLIAIQIVPHQKKGSEPKKIVCNLEDYIQEKYDYKSDNDEMWVVWDREKVDERKKDILEMIPQCKEKNYHIALTNPLFEFWLLLHIIDISLYDRDILYQNEWISQSKNRRFIDKELSNKLENGYSKKKNRFNRDIVTKENILRALEQEKLFENELEKIIDNLGSNVGNLVRRIVNFEEE
jgi:hypothetical protein